jgi:hypothetical protein
LTSVIVQVLASVGCSEACQPKVAWTPFGPVIGSFGRCSQTDWAVMVSAFEALIDQP